MFVTRLIRASTNPFTWVGRRRNYGYTYRCIYGCMSREGVSQPINQPHVCKHRVLDVIAFDLTGGRPPETCTF